MDARHGKIYTYTYVRSLEFDFDAFRGSLGLIKGIQPLCNHWILHTAFDSLAQKIDFTSLYGHTANIYTERQIKWPT